MVDIKEELEALAGLEVRLARLKEGL